MTVDEYSLLERLSNIVGYKSLSAMLKLLIYHGIDNLLTDGVEAYKDSKFIKADVIADEVREIFNDCQSDGIRLMYKSAINSRK